MPSNLASRVSQALREAERELDAASARRALDAGAKS
jgi:hypothetical protein